MRSLCPGATRSTPSTSCSPSTWRRAKLSSIDSGTALIKSSIFQYIFYVSITRVLDPEPVFLWKLNPYFREDRTRLFEGYKILNVLKSNFSLIIHKFISSYIKVLGSKYKTFIIRSNCKRVECEIF